jgi:hypothetical protein
MTDQTDDIYITLRRKAEKLLNQTERKGMQVEFDDVEKLLEELHIHQIELEMQQQELQRINEYLSQQTFLLDP